MPSHPLGVHAAPGCGVARGECMELFAIASHEFVRVDAKDDERSLA
jgi:hypothetical protein